MKKKKCHTGKRRKTSAAGNRAAAAPENPIKRQLEAINRLKPYLERAKQQGERVKGKKGAGEE